MKEKGKSRNENERILRAIGFAMKAHEGQYRKKTKKPYIIHPLGALINLYEYGYSGDILMAGVLHDVIEETRKTYKYTPEDIKDRFGGNVARLVKGATEPDQDLPWKDRKEHTVEYLMTAPKDELLVACADKLNNLRAIAADYEEHGEKLWKRFNASKKNQDWYYRTLAGIFAKRLRSCKMAKQYAKEAAQFFDGIKKK